jgi:uncharacterized protein (TIGR04562 family)
MVGPVDSRIQDFEFPWPLLKVVLQGLSILDVPRLQVRTMEEATDFIRAYGFDPSNAQDQDLLWGFFSDSISFIEKSLADPDFSRVPDHLRSRKAILDLRRLLLMASQKERTEEQVWACAVLRVMHTLIHVAHDPRLKIFEEVQNQVLNRLDTYLYSDPTQGTTHLGRQDEGGGIKLLFFKKKDRKDREREIVKLLHKPENLVEDIYDRIGFRLVTETKFDAIKALRLLIEKNIFGVPNIRPGRSRNRLVDFDRLVFEADRIHTHLQKGDKSAPYIEKLIKRLDSRITFSRLSRSLLNPHTSEYYRAIQFTCRELVKVKNPLWQVYQRLKEPLESLHGGHQVLADAFPTAVNPDLYVFFPYEIQIMDVKSFADSVFGKSNHDEYRKKQVESARRRVFGKGLG